MQDFKTKTYLWVGQDRDRVGGNTTHCILLAHGVAAAAAVGVDDMLRFGLHCAPAHAAVVQTVFPIASFCLLHASCSPYLLTLYLPAARSPL